MKTMPSLLSVLVLVGAMSSSIVSAAGAPRLKAADSSDIIDFYGPCSHDPLGKEAVQTQLLDLQHHPEKLARRARFIAIFGWCGRKNRPAPRGDTQYHA